MRARREIVVWALIVATGALATYQARRFDAAFAVAHTAGPLADLAELVTRARVGLDLARPRLATRSDARHPAHRRAIRCAAPFADAPVDRQSPPVASIAAPQQRGATAGARR